MGHPDLVPVFDGGMLRKPMTGQDDFASMFESSQSGPGQRLPRLEAGQRVEGTILAISGGLVVVDIGRSADATLDLNELEDRVVKVGDRIEATVKNPRADGPVLTLSIGRGGSSVNQAALELALEGGTPVTGTVTASNKGGFSVDVSGVRAFCPISQMDTTYVNEPESFVGQTLDFQIVEIGEEGRNVVLSRRRLLEDERRKNEDSLVDKLEVGKEVEGTIKSTVRHGAIVDLGGLDGFIPISELSHARIERAEDVVTIGESVRAQVLSISRGEKGLSIRLSVKALDAPRADAAPGKDEILDGKVVRHVPGGLIVSTKKGDGLVPTRELALAPGADHRRTYPVDTELRVVVVSRDSASGKLRFSVQRVEHVEERNNFREFAQGSADTSGGDAMGSLGDLMSKKFPELAEKARAESAPQHPAGKEPSPPPPLDSPPPPVSAPPEAPPHKPPSKEHLGVRRRKK